MDSATQLTGDAIVRDRHVGDRARIILAAVDRGVTSADCLERFAERAFAALATPQHRELWSWVERDADDVPSIGAAYRHHLEQPLARRFNALVLAATGATCSNDELDRLSRLFIATTRAAALSCDPAGSMTAADIAALLLLRIEALATVAREHHRVPPPAQADEQARRPLIKRGALTLTVDPTTVHWNDIALPLSPTEAELVSMLVRRGRASSDDIDAMMAARNASTATRDVLIYRIRRKFADVGGVDPIETIRGWGLRLRVERDARGSKALMIGALEPTIPWQALG